MTDDQEKFQEDSSVLAQIFGTLGSLAGLVLGFIAITIIGGIGLLLLAKLFGL